MQLNRYTYKHKQGRGALTTKRVLAGALSVALAVCMATVTGCRDSDALKDIIYDQSSSLIDYNNPNKFYINDSTSQEESDKVSSMEVSDEDPDTDQVQNLVVYSSTPNTVGFTAKKSEFSSTPDFHGIQASESVFFYQSDSIDAFDHAVTPSPEEEEPQPEEQEQPEPEEGIASGDSSATGTGANGSVAGGTSSDPTPSNNGGSKRGKDTIEEENPEDNSGKESSEGIGNDKDFSIAFDVSDLDADTPSVDCFAAYGQYAVIVQMLGGTGALAATDATTLSELNSAGVSNSAVAGWSGSGSPSPGDIDVDVIVNSGAKYIITTDAAEYTRELNDYSMDKLNKAGVQFITLRSMNTSENIKANVETIGEMLQGSSKAAYGGSANERASHYANVHDSVVKEANGGLAQDIANDATKVLQYQGSGAIGFSSNSSTYTVLIDDYDPDAVHTAFSFSSGLAYASAGYATTPVSYYIQAGGSINNAAALTTSVSSGKIPVLQFSQSLLSPSSSSWAYSKAVSLLSASALANMARPLLDSGLLNGTAGSNALGLSAGLGTSYMPSAIVTTEKIKQEILDNSEESYGLYHPYGYADGDPIGSAGAQVSGSATPIWSCIGANESGPTADSPQNPLGNSLSEDNVKVIPTGKFCDWTEGTVESFLLSGWVSSEINNSGYDWFSQVSEFYDYFYGISISESAMFK